MTVDEVGDPQYSTFSLCAIDPATGQSGAAVTTRVPVRRPRGAVGSGRRRRRLQRRPRPWSSTARAGSTCWPRASSRRTSSRSSSADDLRRESRQVGVIDMKGRAPRTPARATTTGPAAGRARTTPCRPTSWSAPKWSRRWPRPSKPPTARGMPLAERMILALEAGQAKGGDSRWGNLQSAAIQVADPNDPGRGNDLHRPGDRSRRARRAGGRDEAHLLHDAAPARLSQLLAGRRPRRRRAEAHAARARLLAPVAGGVPRPPTAPTRARLQEPAQEQPGARRHDASRRPQAAAAEFARDYAQFDADHRRGGQVPHRSEAHLFRAIRPGLVDERFVDGASRAAYAAKRKTEVAK